MKISITIVDINMIIIVIFMIKTSMLYIIYVI